MATVTTIASLESQIAQLSMTAQQRRLAELVGAERAERLRAEAELEAAHASQAMRDQDLATIG